MCFRASQSKQVLKKKKGNFFFLEVFQIFFIYTILLKNSLLIEIKIKLSSCPLIEFNKSCKRTQKKNKFNIPNLKSANRSLETKHFNLDSESTASRRFSARYAYDLTCLTTLSHSGLLPQYKFSYPVSGGLSLLVYCWYTLLITTLINTPLKNTKIKKMKNVNYYSEFIYIISLSTKKYIFSLFRVDILTACNKKCMQQRARTAFISSQRVLGETRGFHVEFKFNGKNSRGKNERSASHSLLNVSTRQVWI